MAENQFTEAQRKFLQQAKAAAERGERGTRAMGAPQIHMAWRLEQMDLVFYCGFDETREENGERRDYPVFAITDKGKEALG